MNSLRANHFVAPHTPNLLTHSINVGTGTHWKCEFMVTCVSFQLPGLSVRQQGAVLVNTMHNAFSSASTCGKVLGDQCGNAHAQMDKQTRGRARAHTWSDLTENIKHIRLSLSLSEKSCLISFCKHHLYTEEDFSCHLCQPTCLTSTPCVRVYTHTRRFTR